MAQASSAAQSLDDSAPSLSTSACSGNKKRKADTEADKETKETLGEELFYEERLYGPDVPPRDFSIICPDGKTIFRVHKAYLAIQSEYFARMFICDPTASEVRLVDTIQGLTCSAKNIQLFLAHMYNVGQVHVDDVCALVPMMHYFDASTLRDRVVKQMEEWHFGDNLVLHCQLLPLLMDAEIHHIVNKWLKGLAWYAHHAGHHRNLWADDEYAALEKLWQQLPPKQTFTVMGDALRQGADWRQLPADQLQEYQKKGLLVVGELVNYIPPEAGRPEISAMVLKIVKNKSICDLRLCTGEILKATPLNQVQYI